MKRFKPQKQSDLHGEIHPTIEFDTPPHITLKEKRWEQDSYHVREILHMLKEREEYFGGKLGEAFKSVGLDPDDPGYKSRRKVNPGSLHPITPNVFGYEKSNGQSDHQHFDSDGTLTLNDTEEENHLKAMENTVVNPFDIWSPLKPLENSSKDPKVVHQKVKLWIQKSSFTENPIEEDDQFWQTPLGTKIAILQPEMKEKLSPSRKKKSYPDKETLKITDAKIKTKVVDHRISSEGAIETNSSLLTVQSTFSISTLMQIESQIENQNQQSKSKPTVQESSSMKKCGFATKSKSSRKSASKLKSKAQKSRYGYISEEFETESSGESMKAYSEERKSPKILTEEDVQLRASKPLPPSRLDLSQGDESLAQIFKMINIDPQPFLQLEHKVKKQVIVPKMQILRKKIRRPSGQSDDSIELNNCD